MAHCLHINRQLGTPWVLHVDLDEFLSPSIEELSAFAAQKGPVSGMTIGSIPIGASRWKKNGNKIFLEAAKEGVSAFQCLHAAKL